MDTKEKQIRLERMLKLMTEDDLTKACFDAFIKGVDQGIKIQNMISCSQQKESA